jgi:hypothetical protein
MGKVLHASGSGYFPSCILQDEPPENLKLAGTLEQIMALYWRVKSFKYTLTGKYTIPDSNDITISGGSGIFQQNINPQNEENLVCSGPSLFTGVATLTASTTITPKFYVNLFQDFFKSTESIYKTFFLIESDNVFGGTEFICSIDRNIPEVYKPCGTYSVKIFSQTIKSGTLFQGINPLVIGDVSLIIEPNEYWSYGGTYDTTTGTRL